MPSPLAEDAAAAAALKLVIRGEKYPVPPLTTAYFVEYQKHVNNRERPFSIIPPAPQQSYLANLNVGGPIVKNKLWFNLSFEYNYLQLRKAIEHT